VLLRYGASNGWLDGQPCVVTRPYGRGRITYIGGVLDEKLVDAAAQWMSKSSGVTPVFGPVPDGIEASRRVGPDGTVFVLINFDTQTQTVPLPHPMTSLLDHREVSQIDIPRYGVALLLDAKKP
jgi:beta-galactosidase